ncbi:uncharacterized protein V1518DRAFT_408532 [Limtongia smithiae]|uniref:uncharacterized protein n=1 Tax=Limtongia smithiae TaxID=1125753 RepID=UPI0034CF3BE3
MSAPGLLHKYNNRLVAFEFATSSGTPHANVLLFVGGLGDGLLTVPYVSPLAAKLDTIGWGCSQLLISSSYRGWGTGSLARDASEIDDAVTYFSGLRHGKVVLMGHSTGSQDTIYYLTRHAPSSSAARISGGIMQAPVSDREAMQVLMPELYADLLAEAITYTTTGKGDEVLPQKFAKKFLDTPISASRWVSLATKLGDDDFFSSDIEQEHLKSTFGVIDVPVLVLYSGSDEYVPLSVDKTALVSRWKAATKPGIWSDVSQVVKGATHNLGKGSEETSMEDALDAILAFVSSL